ncbi:bi-domain-containing oxidoreductase [Endozoicomonas sp. 2B-B]
MLQILQNMSSGETTLVEAPSPKSKSGQLLIQSKTSLISAGTERMLVEFGQANLLEKARQQPDKVKMVIEKVRTDGLATTLDTIKSKLDQPLPLGYCHTGVVLETGNGVTGFSIGDRVVSNGPHADIVRVPQNLCAKIPNNVDDETAAFTVLAAIGLQGVRLAQPTLGECVVVTGLGLIGLVTVQLLRAQGCRVLGVDFDEDKLALARLFGAETVNLAQGEDPVAAGMAFSRGKGVDAVLVTASTKSNDPVTQAARMSRKRGRIILVGVTGLNLRRADFYEKELSFQVSCSYGPGRYDSNYEEKGQDYPMGFVRWTEQRNFEAILDMMADERLDMKPLISHRFAFNDALKAYQTLTDEPKTLGILLQYPNQSVDALRVDRVALSNKTPAYLTTDPVCGFIGAGNYASRILIPAFQKAGTIFHTIVTSTGVSGVHHGKKAGFTEASTSVDDMLANPAINTVTVVTQHNSHAAFVTKALQAGKNVFVEKPLALNHDEIDGIVEALGVAEIQPRLMVGYNRRFSPQIQKMKTLLDAIKEPKSFIMTMNAGAIPADHWTQDPAVGGGRIIGEACHYIDLMRHLAGSPITSYQATQVGNVPSVAIREDKAAIMLNFADGSFGVIHYLANGGSSFPKERIEVFAAGATLQIDNYRRMTGYNWPGFRKMNLNKQNKGQEACAEAFLSSIREGRPTPIPLEQIIEVARVTVDVVDALREG